MNSNQNQIHDQDQDQAQNQSPSQNLSPGTKSITLKFSWRIISLILLLIIVSMFALWRPWIHAAAATRKISITGEATVTGVPDEFVFYPSYDRTGTDATKMKNDLNDYGTSLQTALVKLGVSKNDVTLDSSSYDNTDYTTTDTPSGGQTITLDVTITARNQIVAQKVQTYLAGTDAKGELTSQPQFSDSKQKDLENAARQKAITNAKSQADQTAKNLGAKLGKVIEVNDQQNGGIVEPLGVANGANSATTDSSLPVTPGENQVSSSVQVVFAIK